MGITSPGNGMLEVMLHRRPEADDEKGLPDGVLDSTTVSISTWHMLRESQESQRLRHKLSKFLNNPLVILCGKLPNEATESLWKEFFHTGYTVLEC